MDVSGASFPPCLSYGHFLSVYFFRAHGCSMTAPKPHCICEPEGWLVQDKQHREFAFAVRQALEKLSRPYAYQREHALATLLQILGDVDRSTIPALDRALHTGDERSSPFPNVIRSVLRTIFATWVDAARLHALQRRSPQEKTLAMHVFEGYCLLFPSASQTFADGGVKAVLQEFYDFNNDPTRHSDDESVCLLCACIDALLAGSLKGSHVQQNFLEMDGPTLMLKVMASPAASQHLRQSILDCLAMMVQILAQTPGQTSRAQRLDRFVDSLGKAMGPALAAQLCDTSRKALEGLAAEGGAEGGAGPAAAPPMAAFRGQLYQQIYAACSSKS